MPQFGTASWQLDLPPDWQGTFDEDCSTIVRTQGTGALQLSGARKDEEVTDADLRDFAAEHLDAGATAHPVQLGDFSGFRTHFRWTRRSGIIGTSVKTPSCSSLPMTARLSTAV